MTKSNKDNKKRAVAKIVKPKNDPTVFEKKTFLGKDFWKGLGVIFALIFSVLSFYQSIKNENRQKKQYEETRNDLKMEKLKNDARDWFADGKYDESLKCYEQIFSENPDDVEGYRKFLNIGEILLTVNGKCDTISKRHFERAKKLTKDTVYINQKLELCK